MVFHVELVGLVLPFAFSFEKVARTLVASDVRSPPPLLLSLLLRCCCGAAAVLLWWFSWW